MATDANPQPEKYVSSVIKYSMKRNFNKKKGGQRYKQSKF